MKRPFSEHAGRKIPMLSSKIRAKLDKIGMECGISPVEAATMQFVAGESGPVYQKDIEKEFNISAASATQRLNQMEKKHLIRREVEEQDIRCKRIIISEKSKDCQQVMLDGMLAMEERLTDGIPEEKLEIFYEVLDRMIANVEKL